MNLKDWQKSGDYFDYESKKIFYRYEKSEKETLLCLHGFPDCFVRLSQDLE